MIGNRTVEICGAGTDPVASTASRRLDVLCLGLLCVGLAAGGCATGTSRERRQFILEAVRPGEPLQSVFSGSLEVHRFSVDAAFVTRNLVYRLGEFEYEVDYYRQFLVSPGAMITEQTRQWLADSGLFAQVLPTGSRVMPSYTLEGNVTALYGDFTNASSPAAVMEIRFFLLDNARNEEKVVFARDYRVSTPMPDKTAEVLMDTMNKSLATILGRLEADLQKASSGKSGEAGRVQTL
ncbi:MAG: ABC-type transport auxiliary lipoprotein family protein [Solirubrobacterales bacterium]|jgi:cholesterol transport system auxiliary component